MMQHVSHREFTLITLDPRLVRLKPWSQGTPYLIVLLHHLHIVLSNCLPLLLSGGSGVKGIIGGGKLRGLDSAHPFAKPHVGLAINAYRPDRVPRKGHVAKAHLIIMFSSTSDPSSRVNITYRYINANIGKVAGSYFKIAQITGAELQAGLESNAVRAAWISCLIKQLLGTLRVIPVVLLELFGPLLKWGVIPLYAEQPNRLQLS